MSKTNDDVVEEVFAVWDKNGDGFASCIEIRDALLQAGHLSHDKVMSVMNVST